MNTEIFTPHHLHRINGGGIREADDMLAEEAPVALVYNGIAHVVLMATPADLPELALGFSLSEGILQQAREAYDIEVQQGCNGIEVHLEIASERFQALKARRRSMSGRSGCGLCGIDSLAAVQTALPKVMRGSVIQAADIQTALADLHKHQHLRSQTGAAHGAAWVEQGIIRHAFEDIGRHNALDKLIGIRARQGWSDGFVIVTSRASYEMVHKVAEVGVELLAAISAPTALAVDLAHSAGLTLAGFVRGERAVVYAGAGRLVTG